jgi:hypothetical protein
MTLLHQILSASNISLASLFAPRAYIDPNTGGMLFQMLAVILALFSGFVFFFSRQIKSFFAKARRRMRGEPEPVIQETEETSETEKEI